MAYIKIPSSGGITALTGDVTASGIGSVAATIAAGAITPAKISTTNTDNFSFPNDVTVKGILKWDGGTTKWQAYVVGNTDLYFRDTTNNRNLLQLSQNGIVQMGNSIYLDFSGGGIRNCPSILMNTNSGSASAIFQADSTTQGMLFPRMNTTQRDAIASPATGLTIYNTTNTAVESYNGATWAGGGGGSPGGADTQLQYNSSGSFAGSADLTWTNAAAVLDVSTVSDTGYIQTATYGIRQRPGNGSGFVGDITAHNSGAGSDHDILIENGDFSDTALISSIALCVDKSGGHPDDSALFEVSSTTQGLLLPRMTTTQRDAISSPAEGLLIYNTSTHKINIRVAAGWEAVTSA